MAKIGRRGSLTGHLTVKGVQGHIAYPQLADNPTHRLARMIVALTDDAARPRHRAFRAVDAAGHHDRRRQPGHQRHPGRGHAPASTSASTTASIRDAWRREVRRRLDAGRRHLRAAHRMLGRVVRDAARAAQRPGHGGGRGRDRPARRSFRTTGGTSDARFIKDYCPVIEFGLVGATMHKVDENVAIADILQLSDIYERILDSYFHAQLD